MISMMNFSGRIPDQTGKFAEGISIEDTFGIKTLKSVPAGLVVNPKITREEVNQQAIEGLQELQVFFKEGQTLLEKNKIFL